jgi:hypothetical protein
MSHSKVVCLVAVVAMSGCGRVPGVLSALGVRPKTITLRLINETAFAVDPGIYVSSVDVIGDLIFDGITESLLTVGINRQDFGDLQPGEIVTRTYDCDQFDVVMAKNAEIRTGVGFSPGDDSDLFIDGEDFGCGDTVTVRYVGGVTGFRAGISAAAFDPLQIIGVLTNGQ